jgi:ribosomal protein S18 acetylase RimI-like enzyme
MKVIPKFTLRQANIDDAPLFYSVIDSRNERLRQRTMREFIITTWGAWNESRVQSESREHSISPNALVIQVGDIAAGVFLVERYPTHIQLAQIYLLPEYQRLGIGSVLIDSLIIEGSQSKIPIRLHVIAVNPAKRFYEQFGFVVTKATSDLFFMEKVT